MDEMTIKQSDSPAIQSMIRVVIAGTYPPPIGGISVHIKRLKQELDKLGVECIVYDLGASEYKNPGVVPMKTRVWLVNCLLSAFNKQIVHYHEGGWKQRAILSLISKLSLIKTVYTFHSLRDDMKSLGLLTRICIKLTLYFGDYFIAVSPEIHDKLTRLGASSEKIRIIPAFLPPRFEQSDFDAIGDYVWQFISEHFPIVTANAYRISFYQEEDLYGIDMCIKLCADLKHDFPTIGFVFCLPDIGDETYFQRLRNLLATEGLIDNFLFVTEQIAYYPILASADLFVRPTNTDGDAISIREALSLGTPVVCSDVVSRPDGVTLFKNRNTDDLLEKSRQILLSPAASRKDRSKKLVNSESSQAANASAIYRVYRELLEPEHPRVERLTERK